MAFWPGLMSPDSLDQWDQMLHMNIYNSFPAFHTLTNWVITRLWHSPAAVALAQILALSLLFGLTIQEFAQWRVPQWARILITIVSSVSLVNGMTVITLWKDVPYAIALTGLFTILLRVGRTDGDLA